jgi:hypothetical protein
MSRQPGGVARRRGEQGHGAAVPLLALMADGSIWEERGMATEVWGVLLAPVIVGLVEVAKRAGLPSRFAPLLALALGVGVVGAVAARPDAARVLLWGAALGLSACGLYSGGRALMRGGGVRDGA